MTPSQQQMRLLLDLFADLDALLADLVPGRFAEAAVLLILMRTALEDWVRTGRPAVPAAATRTIRAHGIAASYGRSPETLRRHTRWLVAHDYLCASPGGLFLSPSPANAARMVRAYAVIHDLLLRFVRDGMRCGAIRLDGTAARPVAPADVLRRALDIMLVPLEQHMMDGDDPVASATWCLVAVFGVRHVTLDPVLSARLLDVPVPDAMRRPVATAEVARILRLPHTTIWRRLRTLEASGSVARRGRGWIVPQAALDDPAVAQPLYRTVAYALRKVRELDRLGLSADGVEHGRLVPGVAAALT